MNRKPRIVVYGLGQYGKLIVRFAHEKGWPIVAAFNRAGSKVGKDVGRVAGLDTDIGVIVQDCDTASYAGLQADVGIVAVTDNLSINFPAYKRLLGAGLNVICHGSVAIYPQIADATLAAEIDRLARANNVTFTGTGIWDMSRIWSALLVTGPCTQIDSIFHRSVTDMERFGHHTVVTSGVGMTVDEFNEKIANVEGVFANHFTVMVSLVMNALGYTVTSCSERREPVVSDQPFHCRTLGRELSPGTCLGTRYVVKVKTAQQIPTDVHIESRVLFRPGESEHMLWAVTGKPSARILIERDDSTHMSASSMFNRIRDVITAPPGIQLITSYGPMKHTALG